MDKKSVDLATQATERLFRLAQTVVDPQGELRPCDWLMQAVWHQLVALSSASGTAALFSRALAEAGRTWPLVQNIKVDSNGIDSSALHQLCQSNGCEPWVPACKAVVRNCLSVVTTLMGERLSLALISRVEDEIETLGTPPEDLGPSEQPASIKAKQRPLEIPLFASETEDQVEADGGE